MTVALHKLLRRQLQRHSRDGTKLRKQESGLLKAISETYAQYDQRTSHLEEALEACSSELAEARMELEACLRALAGLLLVVDRSGLIAEWHCSEPKEFGLPASGVTRESILELFPDSVNRRFETALRGVARYRSPVVIEYALQNEDEPRYYEARFQPGVNEHVVVAIRNITEYKMAETRLREAHAETERLLASISSILIGIGPDDRVTRWNAAAEKTFNIPATEVIGKPFLESKIQWNWEEVLTKIAECQDEEKPTPIEEVRYTRPDGREGFLSFMLNPIVREGRAHAGYLLLGSDVTERKVLESQLSQAQKLEAIGQLAAGIAHEINTPIQYVGDNTCFLQDAFGELSTFIKESLTCLEMVKASHPELAATIDEKTQELDLDYLLDEIPVAITQTLEGVERVANIVRAMKEFSHPGGREQTLTDLNKALENTLTVSRNEWKYVAEVTTEFDPSLPLVPCYPDELNQAFLNIIVNAAHAIAEIVDEESEKKGLIEVQTRMTGNWVEIRISDTGPGIPREIRSRIFDPFFTTKEVGKGTGQGLAIAHNVIVEKHGGQLTCESTEGEGTTFCIRLPWVSKQGTAEEKEAVG